MEHKSISVNRAAATVSASTGDARHAVHFVEVGASVSMERRGHCALTAGVVASASTQR